MSGGRYEAVIGLEVHVQLRSRSKIFCACSTEYGASPNTHVCPVCLGHPGVLPVLNERVASFAARFGLAVGASIRERSVFARKNYFYPDLPKGYQITQYEEPVLVGGRVPYRIDGTVREVRLVRAHLEEDAGKSFHPESGRDPVTLVDLNRAGVPLLEVVTEPDLRSPEEAQAALERIHQLVVYLEICDGNLEEGSLRADANVSVRPRGQETLNPKTEIKNLNSFRNVHRALVYEIQRQSRILDEGGGLEQATRLWDAAGGRTRVMRTKEDAHDYRYFPEPDLPALHLGEARIQQAGAEAPELPWTKEERFHRDYGLSWDDAVLLATTRESAAYFETAAEAAGDGKAAANWIMTEVLHLVKESPEGWAGVRVSPAHLGRMVGMIREGTISGKIGKTVFARMAETGEAPGAIVAAQGLVQISDAATLAGWLDTVLAAHPGPVADYTGGKTSALQFLVGQVMRESRGRANPGEVVRALENRLGGGTAPDTEEAGG